MVAAAGLLGALIGSFLNVVAYRLPRGESLVTPASHCTGCGEPVRPYDNVPVLSWLLLRGKCRGCGERISARYPLIELMTALAFAAVALARGLDSGLLLELPFTAMLIAVAAIDLEHRIIPNRILLPMAVWGLAAGAAIDPDAVPEMLIAGTAAFTFLLLAALAYPAGMGMGDVKLAGVMGIYLGASVGPALFVALVAGSVAGIALIARDGREGRKKGIPFGPFLALGALVGLLAGPELVDIYVDRFLS